MTSTTGGLEPASVCAVSERQRRLQGELARRVPISTRLTSSQMELVQQAVAASGLSVCEWTRQQIVRGATEAAQRQERRSA